MRTLWLVSGCVMGMMICEGPAAAQTVVEYGAAGSAAATATTATKGVGSSIGGVLDSLGKTLNQAEEAPKVEPATSGHTATRSSAKAKRAPAKAPAAPVAPRPVYEDAMGIQKGMSCDEVIQRFGPPAMAFAGESDAKTMSYAGKTGGVQVECQGGKVASVEKPN